MILVLRQKRLWSGWLLAATAMFLVVFGSFAWAAETASPAPATQPSTAPATEPGPPENVASAFASDATKDTPWVEVAFLEKTAEGKLIPYNTLAGHAYLLKPVIGNGIHGNMFPGTGMKFNASPNGGRDEFQFGQTYRITFAASVPGGAPEHAPVEFTVPKMLKPGEVKRFEFILATPETRAADAATAAAAAFAAAHPPPPPPGIDISIVGQDPKPLSPVTHPWSDWIAMYVVPAKDGKPVFARTAAFGPEGTATLKESPLGGILTVRHGPMWYAYITSVQKRVLTLPADATATSGLEGFRLRTVVFDRALIPSGRTINAIGIRPPGPDMILLATKLIDKDADRASITLQPGTFTVMAGPSAPDEENPPFILGTITVGAADDTVTVAPPAK